MSIESIVRVTPVLNNPDLEYKSNNSSSRKPTNPAHKEVNANQTANINLFETLQDNLMHEDHEEDVLFFKKMLESNSKQTNDQIRNETLLESLADSVTSRFKEAKYIAHQELESLLSFFEDDNLSFKKVDGLIDEMVKVDEAQAEILLAKFLNNSKLSIAQIYMILNYIIDNIAKKRRDKKRLTDLISVLLKRLEHQESGYLFEFFSLLAHPEIKKDISLMNGLASISSGNVTVNSVKQMLNFVQNNLGGDFENMVSSCLNNRASILKRLTVGEINFEQKTELAEYIKFEKILITLHSLYIKAFNFSKLSSESQEKIVLVDDYYKLLSSLIGLAENALVSEISINNFFKQIIKNPSQLTPGFLNKLLRLYDNFPMLVYNDTPQQKTKVLDGIRLLAKSLASKEVLQPKFAFLKNDVFVNKKNNKIKFSI